MAKVVLVADGTIVMKTLSDVDPANCGGYRAE
jgi:hypothetical protein